MNAMDLERTLQERLGEDQDENTRTTPSISVGPYYGDVKVMLSEAAAERLLTLIQENEEQ